MYAHKKSVSYARLPDDFRIRPSSGYKTPEEFSIPMN